MPNFFSEKYKILFAGALINALVLIIVIILASGIIYSERGEIFGSFADKYFSESANETGEKSIMQRRDALVISIVEQANPAVFSIAVRKASLSPSGEAIGQPVQIGGGSGFFISNGGLAITNEHVVRDEDASYSVFTKDGRELGVSILDKNKNLDLALLKVEAGNTPFLQFGDSENLKLGETVIAIGNALGEFNNSVSVGIISGLSRSIVAQGDSGAGEPLEKVIQTDAAINPGNSGGPLINLEGKVIGVNVAIAQGSENIGFALPSDLVKNSFEIR